MAIEKKRNVEDPAAGKPNIPSSTESEETSNGLTMAENLDLSTVGRLEEESQTKNQSEGSDEKKQLTKNEENKWFKDVEETGRWGALPKMEIFIAVAVTLAVIVVVVILVVLLAGDNSVPSLTLSPAPSLMSTVVPTEVPTIENNPQDVLQHILDKIGLSPSNADTLKLLPVSVDSYEKSQAEDTSQTPQVRALSWLLYTDPSSTATSFESPLLIARYVLAVVYYTMGGVTNSWSDSTNWLTEKSVCEWNGIECNRAETYVEKINMPLFPLQNEIPNELALLANNMKEMMFRGNELTGSIPSGLLEMTELRSLFLDNNQMSGTIPTELASIGLVTVRLQHNNFLGTFPFEFCNGLKPRYPLEFFSVDCYTATKEGLVCFCCLETDCF
eukprot:CAMPEP_0195296766 /NCGR_PEP_ID=MMETSP0707-20130614/20118_1 /TAXON_ID=33640 /ORGANISM="Asterionellopsis glacialis, Strain CCMP134" /LENGTH=386 /DNA_ID=CAMNT_0040358369 /DNA_START=118 /DNA_END=1278 /DNA_ORIENTATION=-